MLRSTNATQAVTFVAFDAVVLDGESVCERPDRKRRAAPEALHVAGPGWCTIRSLDAGQRELLNECATLDVKGLVAKPAGSPYRPGWRSTDWLKRKTPEWNSAHAPRPLPRSSSSIEVTPPVGPTSADRGVVAGVRPDFEHPISRAAAQPFEHHRRDGRRARRADRDSVRTEMRRYRGVSDKKPGPVVAFWAGPAADLRLPGTSRARVASATNAPVQSRGLGRGASESAALVKRSASNTSSRCHRPHMTPSTRMNMGATRRTGDSKPGVTEVTVSRRRPRLSISSAGCRPMSRRVQTRRE
jgi:hypothetical protein